MNKYDLRYQKTEIAIKEAYHKLKKNDSSEVRVNDLCKAAMINKSTFYSHYETIEILHKQICTEFVQSTLAQCKHIDNLQHNLKDLFISVYHLFADSATTISQLYGNDIASFVNDVENCLMNHFISNSIDTDTRLKIQFCIGGAVRILLYESTQDCIQKTVELVEKVLL